MLTALTGIELQREWSKSLIRNDIKFVSHWDSEKKFDDHFCAKGNDKKLKARRIISYKEITNAYVKPTGRKTCFSFKFFFYVSSTHYFRSDKYLKLYALVSRRNEYIILFIASFPSDFRRSFIRRQFSVKLSNNTFDLNHLGGSRVASSVQTDRTILKETLRVCKCF